MALAVENDLDEPADDRSAGTARRFDPSSPIVITIVLLAVYFLFAGLLNDSGYLGTDTGGKVATLEASQQAGEWTPDLGYWAEQEDPDGSLYPFFGTRRLESGWINITSIPMPYLAQPLYNVGGLRLALLLPMLGGVAAALGAGALARRFGDDDGVLVTWMVGLGSPVLVYALDFWEHSIGVGVMTVATVLTIDSTRARHGWIQAGGAGLLFALAASMRQEAFIYGAVAGLILLWGRSPFQPIRNGLRGASMFAGFVVGYLINGTIESEVFGVAERAERAAGIIGDGGGRGALGQKVGDALLTLASPINLFHPLSFVLAIVLLAGFVGLAYGLVKDDETATKRSAVVLGVFVLLVGLRTAQFGPGFVPGMIAVSPLAGIGLGFALVKRNAMVLAFSVAPLPLVWWFQYPGAAAPQWAGRYILQSGLVLTVFGLVILRRNHERALAALVGAQLVMAALGLWMLVDRTNSIAEISDEVAAIDDVVVFSQPFYAREMGPAMLGRQWLSAETEEERDEAVQLLLERDVDRFVWVVDLAAPDTSFEGFTGTRVGEIPNSWISLRLVEYVAD